MACEFAQWIPLLTMVIIVLIGIIFSLWWMFILPKDDVDIEKPIIEEEFSSSSLSELNQENKLNI